MFLAIARKQSNKKAKQLCLYKIGIYYLLGRKQAKSDCFSEMVHLFEVRPLPNLSLSLGPQLMPLHLPSIF